MTDVLLTGVAELNGVGDAPITDCAIAIQGGRISYSGPAADAPSWDGEVLDCEGRAVIPGFVDAHTHLVFAGDRADEFSARLEGASYSEIAASGGGILSTVRATREASFEDLYAEAARRVWRMVRSGTTTIEIKSGYGLDLQTEVRLLKVARAIGERLRVTVKTTFLGGHSVPPEFVSDRQGYVELVVDEMLPAVAGLADYCDVFVEEGVFTVEEARRILLAGRSLGLEPRVHADQLSHTGGAALAAEIGAASADHLDHITEDDARSMAEVGVTAVLVPGASYSLRSRQAPGPMLIDSGCRVAIATDCNPGTSYFESMGPVISLAVVQMGLSTDQALAAATRGGAESLGMTDRGHLETGAWADLVILDAPSARHIPYRPATNLVWKVFKEGLAVG